ncbi:MAG: 6,7-dimethyl-8-ribityllumazine synthase [Bacteroidetes bacterium]|nr:6,7-dimethyl-8-ribityllumazine synthase [Bacteroidota bacterium]
MSSTRLHGSLNAAGKRFALVVSRFNSEVTEGLLAGAFTTLVGAGASESDITIIETPGAFEIPIALEWLALGGSYDALVALGAVIQGETSHYDHISEAAMRGIQSVSLKYGIPIACGVLTTFTDEQAVARSSDTDANKGREAALAAIEMVNLKPLL